MHSAVSIAIESVSLLNNQYVTKKLLEKGITHFLCGFNERKKKQQNIE